MDWLLDRFAEAPDRLAFVHENRRVTYADAINMVSSFRRKLAETGVAKGESVVILGDYSPELFCLMLALAQIGAVVIPLTRHSVVEESVALSVSGCHWFVEIDPNGIGARFVRRDIPAKNALLTAFLVIGEPGLILFSSGSTGKPKGILHNLNRVAEKFRKQRYPVVAIPFLMIDHFGGINTILAITSSLGTVVTVVDRSVGSICRAIEAHKVELLPTTPSFLTTLMASGAYRDYDLSSLKRITYGTEVMVQSTLDRVCEAFPHVELQQTYGLSEVGVLRSQSRGHGSLWVRVGGDGFQTKIIDGILWVKSDYAMVGYLNAPSEFDADGWFNTKDQVEVDGDYFRILGRITDIINVGGQKVYPAEVEDVVLTLDNVRDVAVFGEPNKLLGQIVVVKVRLNAPEALQALKRRIRAACHRKLAPYKVPAKVLVSEEDLYTARQKKSRRA
jgi:acyl-coenzyme A synthetase/AMP-(fatty) acid ligase